MRHSLLAALIAGIATTAQAAPTWQTISSEPGKRIELDRTTIKRDGNTVQAQGRVVLEKELSDAKSGAPYRVIEAVAVYDCANRSATTVKRIYKKNDRDIVREEDIKGVEMPVRSGTLDDKVLREVCRPPKDSQAEIASKANEAASELKAANDALIKKEMTKAEKPPVIKAADSGDHGAIPSIRPNLKAQMEGKQEATPPAAKEGHTASTTREALPQTPSKASGSIYVRTSAQATPAPIAHAPAKARKPASQSGYMLEVAAHEPALQHAHIHWSYEGEGAPENWSKLDPKNTLCATGQRQSPIDIRDGIKVDLEPITFNYRPSNFRVIDNGHTIQVEQGDGNIALTGKSYELVQFHFHRPSEERINGRRFDMVAHLVHKSDEGQLAVVAVMMELGSENPFIQTLWNNLPLEKNSSVTPPSAVIDLNSFLPAGRSYYTYMGSLTTPPCSEGVLWLVMKQPVQVSQEQLNIFARLYRNNARPIQSATGRLIKESR